MTKEEQELLIRANLANATGIWITSKDFKTATEQSTKGRLKFIEDDGDPEHGNYRKRYVITPHGKGILIKHLRGEEETL